jgi:hypothetical protein
MLELIKEVGLYYFLGAVIITIVLYILWENNK